MKHYEKPMIVASEDTSEGVFASSGSVADSNCWTLTVTSLVDYANGSHLFSLVGLHIGADHISKSADITLTFNNNVTNASIDVAQGQCTFSGNKVYIKHFSPTGGSATDLNLYAKLFVSAGSMAATKALACTSFTITCNKA